MANPSTTAGATPCTEVMGLILAIDTSRALGPHEISEIMLKNTALSIAPSVTKHLNLSTSTGSTPHKWKISSVLPIPKSSASTINPSKYRCISLLPAISTLLEHIYSIVLECLFGREVFTENQWWGLPQES